MLSELSSLESKLDQLLAVHMALRTENQELRTRVAALEAENRQLDEKVEGARLRLEALLAKLPE